MSEPRGVGGDVVRSEAVVGELGWCVGVRWGFVWDRRMGGVEWWWGRWRGWGSANNKWQFSVWSEWLPSTGPLDCRGLLRGLRGEAKEEDE